MDKTDFLKCLSTMRTIFEVVSTAASSLMEMNAMNVSPTQEESAQLQEAFGDIRDQLYQLKAESQEKIQEYNARKEETAIAAEGAIGEYTRMQQNLIQLEKANGEAKVALAQKYAEKDEIQRACRKSEADLEDIRQRRDEEVRKSKKKADDLKKWFWVPRWSMNWTTRSGLSPGALRRNGSVRVNFPNSMDRFAGRWRSGIRRSR